MSRRFLTATLAATLLVILTASAAMAGEVTGNGRKVMTIENSKWGTGLHARSVCAYSGQEDLQFFVDEETDSVRVENPVKGVAGPLHSRGARSRKAVRDFLDGGGLTALVTPATRTGHTASSG